MHCSLLTMLNMHPVTLLITFIVMRAHNHNESQFSHLFSEDIGADHLCLHTYMVIKLLMYSLSNKVHFKCFGKQVGFLLMKGKIYLQLLEYLLTLKYLVLELPFSFSCRSIAHFSVSLLLINTRRLVRSWET